MANDFSAIPMIFDTDFSSFQTASGLKHNVRVRRFALCVASGATSSTGAVQIAQAAAGNRALYEPIPVTNGVAARTILLTDGPWSWDDALVWPDFAVTGLTATGTILYVWLRSN